MVIAGSDNEGHCEGGGLILHCISQDETSPWHDFVSDDTNWVDENNQAPECADTSGGFLDRGLSFVNEMLAKGAKKIWANRKEITFTGSPS